MFSWWLREDASGIRRNGKFKSSTVKAIKWVWGIEISIFQESRGVLGRSSRCWGEKKNAVIIGLVENRRYAESTWSKKNRDIRE